ncbi:hypothetical protein JK386_09725 [Nocardioides sp. zg-536]|uniref:Uncharacterized protein n=1 Tax=Nocardioides faecalis TaxID=2803858 RepID=A0A939BW38_9ACTN|nr:hypothetical protein [Nocardioides faecalis]MBM9460182.1 hypothetical protein [Nocardioides faecalis]QVI60023.1 hypothetical protein KG111_06880 [Nocardioides faecalis]
MTMPTFTMSPAPTGSIRPRAVRRAGRGALLLSLAPGAVFLAGCGNAPTTASPVVPSSELADAGKRPCPEELPTGDDPSGHGFGADEPADERPDLLAPEEAWVCQYWPFDAGTTADGGAVFGWTRKGDPEPVPAGDLPALKTALDDLAPADRNRACTADLGARWMIVYSHGGDQTGVVVDDYGCRDVRLTDDPHATAPGSEDQRGTVGGVLDGGRAVLDAVGVGRSD